MTLTGLTPRDDGLHPGVERIETGAAVGSCLPAPVVFDEPGREGFGLLGEAWRSSRPSLVQTGRLFDVVQAPEYLAAPVLRQLERLGARRGAVFANGDQWHFVVPLGSGFVPPELGGPDWPSPVRYLNGEWITVPPRGARSAGERVRWVTRVPSGQLYTAPVILFAGFTALGQRPVPWITKGPADEPPPLDRSVHPRQQACDAHQLHQTPLPVRRCAHVE